MRKKLAVASFAAFLVAASLTACGSSKDAQTTAAQTEVQTEAAETEVQEEKTETEASADDRAYEGTTLNVMLAYGGAEKSFDAFTEKTGIKVEYVRHLCHQFPQHTDSPDSRIKHTNRTFLPVFILFHCYSSQTASLPFSVRVT